MGRWRPLLSRIATVFPSDRPVLPLLFSFSWCRLHVGPSGQVGLPHVTNSLAGCCVLGLGCWDWMCSGLLRSRVFMRAMGANLVSRTKVIKRRKEPGERKFCRACGAKRGREPLRGRSICAGIHGNKSSRGTSLELTAAACGLHGYEGCMS